MQPSTRAQAVFSPAAHRRCCCCIPSWGDARAPIGRPRRQNFRRLASDLFPARAVQTEQQGTRRVRPIFKGSRLPRSQELSPSPPSLRPPAQASTQREEPPPVQRTRDPKVRTSFAPQCDGRSRRICFCGRQLTQHSLSVPPRSHSIAHNGSDCAPSGSDRKDRRRKRCVHQLQQPVCTHCCEYTAVAVAGAVAEPRADNAC